MKELELKNESWKINHLYNVGIDFETNKIEGIFKGEYICLFDFNKYDMSLSNRWVDYKISVGEVGITIEFTSSK